MASATPSSISLTEKKRLWQEAKYREFEQISQDKSSMFNYFLQENDLFRMISDEDQLKFRTMQQKCENEKQNVFFGSLGAIFLIDQVIFRYALPNFQIPRFRLTTNVFKYVLAPCLISYIYRDYFMGEYQIFFYNMQEKYQFGFNDFMQANRIFERALAVDRLDQLLEKRSEFDWTGIPELDDKKPGSK